MIALVARSRMPHFGRLSEQSYSDDSCEPDACVLNVSQDLNGDGQLTVLYNFIVAEAGCGLKWTQKAFARLPDGFSKTQLLHALPGIG